MKFIKYILLALVVVLFAAFLNYFLPSRDIVQVVGTDVKRMDIESKAWFWDKADAGTNDNTTRDVRFINAVWPNGKSRVYRNEDTNWSFPPYFKFDSGDLNAQAQDLGRQDDIYVAVSHYGWRIKLFSIFPNAYKIKRVDGPDVRLIPWFNIVFLTILAALIFLVYRFFSGLKRKHVDPVVDGVRDEVNERADDIQDGFKDSKSAASGFMRRWFGSE